MSTNFSLGKPCKRGNMAPSNSSGCTCEECRNARRERVRAAWAGLSSEEKAKRAEKLKTYRQNNPEYRERANAKLRAMHSADGRLRLWYASRERAKKLGLPHTIAIEDIHIPDVCPALGIPLRQGTVTDRSNSPSLDRIRPELGYVPGNIAVISYRANTIKQNATSEELLAVAAWVEKVTTK